MAASPSAYAETASPAILGCTDYLPDAARFDVPVG
jgi:hypothetical protein